MWKFEFHIIFVCHEILFFWFFLAITKCFKKFLASCWCRKWWQADFDLRVQFAEPWPKLLTPGGCVIHKRWSYFFFLKQHILKTSSWYGKSIGVGMWKSRFQLWSVIFIHKWLLWAPSFFHFFTGVDDKNCPPYLPGLFGG